MTRQKYIHKPLLNILFHKIEKVSTERKGSSQQRHFKPCSRLQKMIRKILGVIIGYATFVATSLALFKLSGQDPHGQATTNFQILTAIYGTVFSFLSGIVLQLIAKTKNLNLNYILAFIIAGFATFSLIKSNGNHWTHLLAIIIFAPVSILGGLFFNKRNNK